MLFAAKFQFRFEYWIRKFVLFSLCVAASVQSNLLSAPKSKRIPLRIICQKKKKKKNPGQGSSNGSTRRTNLESQRSKDPKMAEAKLLELLSSQRRNQRIPQESVKIPSKTSQVRKDPKKKNPGKARNVTIGHYQRSFKRSLKVQRIPLDVQWARDSNNP